MKNSKYLIIAMLTSLGVVWAILRSGENLGMDLQKNRIVLDASTSLNMKSNTFKVTHRAKPKVSAPSWGSFKSQPVATTVKPSLDKNQDLLKSIAKKVSDKLKKKNEKKKVARKKPGLKNLVTKTEDRVDRNLRKFDDPDSSSTPPIVYMAPRPLEKEVTPEEKEGETLSLQEWAELLLKNPNKKATDDLIGAYKQNKLGQREWAFILAEQMLQSTNSEIQSEGLRILESLPSEESFAILVNQSLQPASEISPSVSIGLQKYAGDLSHLSILEKSVLSDDPRIAAQAAVLIERSARIHLVSAGGRSARSRRETNVPKERYTSALQALEAASEKARDPATKSTLDLALAYLQAIVAGSAVADLN